MHNTFQYSNTPNQTMDFWWSVLLLYFFPLLLLIYLYVRHKFSYWSSRGVVGPAPSLLKLGTIFDRIRYSPPQYELTYLRKYGKVYGLYRGFHPTLTIADAELLKGILVKDFHLFINRAHLNTYDVLWNENIFNARDANWKRIRTIASPSFTSGKLRGLQQLMSACVEKLVQYLERTATEKDGVFSPKEVMAGFTIDVIASTSFATETNANDNDCTKGSAFVRNGLALFRMNPLKILSFLLMPRHVNDLLGIKIQFPDSPFRFFEQLAREIVRQRKGSKVASRRADFVQLLMDAAVSEGDLSNVDYGKLTATDEESKSNKEYSTTVSTDQDCTKREKRLSESELIANSVFLMIAGFETSSSVLHHIIYELVVNEDLQKRLFEELRTSLSGLDVHSTEYYENVMNGGLPYLDAVVKEGLRKYPPLTRVERRCAVDGYKLGESGLTLAKDQHIEIPLYAIHHCHDYYPQPQLFNPDRFLPENKHLLVPYTYVPFGIGPRNCLGLRFAYQEIKMCLAAVLIRFRFSSTIDTPTQLSYKKSTLLLNTLPFTVRVTKRF